MTMILCQVIWKLSIEPPSPLARATAILLSSLLIMALIWSVVGKLDIQAKATGKLVISSYSKVIQSVEAVR